MRVVSTKQNNKSVSRFLVSLLSFGLFLYFAYHLMHGDRGYFAWKGVQQKLAATQEKLVREHAERIALENRVRLLRSDSLDLDLLDERARVVLGFINQDEKIIIPIN